MVANRTGGLASKNSFNALQSPMALAVSSSFGTRKIVAKSLPISSTAEGISEPSALTVRRIDSESSLMTGSTSDLDVLGSILASFLPHHVSHFCVSSAVSRSSIQKSGNRRTLAIFKSKLQFKEATMPLWIESSLRRLSSYPFAFGKILPISYSLSFLSLIHYFYFLFEL
eukprot:GILI01020759.1.p2 GENE.GILI01020759.1~~GILI01020759.1.p2  ORF type:complete len:170 (-),score=0.38 GILI01020759.1:154-663(-)